MAGKDAEDTLAEHRGHIDGHDSGGVGVGLGRSPAIRRGSPRFPPALKVETGARVEDVLAR